MFSRYIYKQMYHCNKYQNRLKVRWTKMWNYSDDRQWCPIPFKFSCFLKKMFKLRLGSWMFLVNPLRLRYPHLRNWPFHRSLTGLKLIFEGSLDCYVLRPEEMWGQKGIFLLLLPTSKEEEVFNSCFFFL